MPVLDAQEEKDLLSHVSNDQGVVIENQVSYLPIGGTGGYKNLRGR